MLRQYGRHWIEQSEIYMPDLIQANQDANDIALEKFHLMGIIYVAFLW